MTPTGKAEQEGAGQTCRFHTAHDEMLKQHGERLDKLEEMMADIQRRLPVWATFLISALCAGLASLATMLAG